MTSDEEKKEEAFTILNEIQDLAGDLWSSIQRYTNKPPGPSSIYWMKSVRDRLKKEIVEQEKNNYELIEDE